MARQFDAIIIGTGQSGPALAARMSAEGLHVAVVERYRFGGTCVNYGCTPTKALVASAKVAYQARRSAEFGINLSGAVEVDMLAVKDRMRRISGESRQAVEGWMKGLPNTQVFEGHASFVNEHSIRVGNEELSAPTFVLNVGTRARVPEFPGSDLENVITNSSLLSSNDLPRHLVIMGAGFVGMEFAQMYRRFGSEVTVITHGTELLSREDADVQDALREILENEGVKLRFNTSIVEAERSFGELTITVENKQGEEKLQATHLLMAVGREPNTRDLGLELAGVKTDARGYILVDELLATSNPGIYAIGDCNGRGAFTHTSYNDYEILADKMFGKGELRVDDRITCYALFTDPPLGRAGLTESQAIERGHRLLVGKKPMSSLLRAKEFGETQGFIKVLVDADSEEILGAAILGLSGDEAVHGLLDVMYSGASYRVLQRAVHIHPTVSEHIPAVLAELKPLSAEGGA